MKLLAVTAVLAASAAALGASAQPQAGPQAVTGHYIPAAATSPVTQGQCFNTRDMQNHTFDGPSTMYVNVTGKGVFKITMSNACAAGAFSSDPIILKNLTGSMQICKPIDLDVSVKTGGGFATPCIVQSIALMAPAEVAALPKKVRP